MSPSGILPVRRLRPALALLFGVSFLAAAVLAFGTARLLRARDVAERIPDGVRAYVVVLASARDEAAKTLRDRKEVALLGERRAGELLASTGAAEAGPDALIVFEVALPAGLGVLDEVEIPGRVDVIDLNQKDRLAFTRQRAWREAVLGLVLTLLGAAVFVWAVVSCALGAGRECQDAIGVRVLLGTDPGGLWGMLGLLVGAVALGGSLSALLVLTVGAQVGMGGMSLPAWWAIPGVLALFAGTLGLALLAARTAVTRAARATILAGVMLLLWLASPASAAIEADEPPTDVGPVRHAEILRALSRDLSVCRRALHTARKAVASTEQQGVRAAVTRDEPLVRLARLKREADAEAVREWQERCSALEAERQRLREVLQSTRLLGPPITPRRPPVEGAVSVRYGQAGVRPGTAAFRNGVGIRTRGGEAIRASAPGRVAYSGELPGSGPVVVLDHGRRTYSVYARIRSSIVEVGEEVDAGQTLARGETGLLYFSIRRRGRAVDPLAWVRADRG